MERTREREREEVTFTVVLKLHLPPRPASSLYPPFGLICRFEAALELATVCEIDNIGHAAFSRFDPPQYAYIIDTRLDDLDQARLDFE